MKIIKADTDNLIFFDVDNTLIHQALGRNGLKINHSQYGVNYVVPVKHHVDLLIDYKMKGYTVIVWSATGWEWVDKVVKKLKLQKYVDYVMCKPFDYVDDLHVSEWFGNRIYLK